MLEKDNQGQVYQEQTKPSKNEKPTNLTPWLIGGSLLFVVGGLLLIWLVRKGDKKIKKAEK